MTRCVSADGVSQLTSDVRQIMSVRHVQLPFAPSAICCETNELRRPYSNHPGCESHVLQTLVNEELKQYFRPEFLNRLDEIIVFRQLSKAEVKEIADIMLKEVCACSE